MKRHHRHHSRTSRWGTAAATATGLPRPVQRTLPLVPCRPGGPGRWPIAVNVRGLTNAARAEGQAYENRRLLASLDLLLQLLLCRACRTIWPPWLTSTGRHSWLGSTGGRSWLSDTGGRSWLSSTGRRLEPRRSQMHSRTDPPRAGCAASPAPAGFFLEHRSQCRIWRRQAFMDIESTLCSSSSSSPSQAHCNCFVKAWSRV